MRERIYVGCNNGGTTREVFRSATEPTAASHGDRYAAVIGPFRTRRAAAFLIAGGWNNPHVQQVADAERIAARL
jgi:hypothetical protein